MEVMILLAVITLAAGYFYFKIMSKLDSAGYFWDAVKLVVAFMVTSEALGILAKVALAYFKR